VQKYRDKRRNNYAADRPYASPIFGVEKEKKRSRQALRFKVCHESGKIKRH